MTSLRLAQIKISLAQHFSAVTSVPDVALTVSTVSEPKPSKRFSDDDPGDTPG